MIIKLKKTFKNVLDIFMLLIPFMDFTYCIDLEFADIRVSYAIYFLYFIIYIRKIFNRNLLLNILKKSKYIIAVSAVIVITSIYNIYLGNNTFVSLFKQITIISFTAFTTWLFFYNHKDNLRHIVNLYLDIAVIAAAIGIFQEISFLTGFTPGWDYSFWKINNQISVSGMMLRVTSIAGEPSNLVYALAPALYIALSSFTVKEKPALNITKSLIVLICFILTYSLIGYAGIFISFTIILLTKFKKLNIFRIFLIIILFLSLVYVGNSMLKYKINDTISAVSKKEQKSVNISTYSIILQTKVAFKNFKEHTLFGSGLGSHFQAFNKYYELFHYYKNHKLLHKQDAASLFLRIISELGLFGIIVFTFSILYWNILTFKNNDKINYFIMINNACLIFIVLRLIRCGVYYSDGFFIFYFLYYYSHALYKKQTEQLQINETDTKN